MTGAPLLDRDMVRARLDGVSPGRAYGRLTRLVGLEAEARGISGAIGDQVWIGDGADRIPAEVVAIRNDCLMLMPYGDLSGLAPGAQVEPAGRRFRLHAGPGVGCRALGGLGRPIDGLGPVGHDVIDLDAPVPHPLKR